VRCAFPRDADKKSGQMFSPRRTLSAVPFSTPQNGHTLCVLGVDPAVAGATGYGVVESDGRRCRMLRFGALRPASRRSSGDPLSTHLRDIHALIAELIREFAPDGVAVESVFTALNVKTALRLAEVRGVILLAAAQAGVASFSYSPREVKATVAGYGHAGKEQVQQMVRAVLGMSETPEPADAADALAVALCHVQMAESERRLGCSTRRFSARLAPLAAAAVRRPRASFPHEFLL
jgi:crossover junction endodeoxyribonuclease RuvC